MPLEIRQKTYLAIHSPRALTIVDAADGKEIWTTPRRQPIGVNAPDPVVEGTKVFVTAGRAFGGALFDVSGATTPLWEQEGLSSHWHTSVLLNGYLFGPDGNNSEGAGRSPTSLRCLDWKTGGIKWTEPKLAFNGLIAVGGKLLVLTETGDPVLAEASPEGYKELGSAHVIEGRAFTAPVFADGKAYARNTRGDVVCLDLGAMSWPSGCLHTPSGPSSDSSWAGSASASTPFSSQTGKNPYGLTWSGARRADDAPRPNASLAPRPHALLRARRWDVLLGLAVHLRGGALSPDARDILGDALGRRWRHGGSLRSRRQSGCRGVPRWHSPFASPSSSVVWFMYQHSTRSAGRLGTPSLGSGFDPRDFAWYAAGVLAAVLVERTHGWFREGPVGGEAG